MRSATQWAFALCASIVACTLLGVRAGTAGSGINPVSRVVKLLQGLTKTIEEEGKAEEDLYEKFVCWGKTIINEKTASNQAAQTRIDSLEAYIKDIEAGKIEFTTERADLEKEIDELTKSMDIAEKQRKQEEEDFTAAKAEMEKAIGALEKALEVLEAGTKPQSSLLALKADLSEGFRERSADRASLERAITFAQRFLSKGDAFFLARLLDGDMPVPDWKKLNKSPLNKKYKARSTKIQELLGDLLSTFKENLEDAKDKEAKAVETYEKLMDSKGKQKQVAEDALAEMAKEGAARAMSKAEAQEEVDALKEQIANDEKYIAQTEAALKKKEEEWEERKKLRIEELEAISKAIEILHSDDARDTFKKSYESQGFLLQLEASSSRRHASLAQSSLRKLAAATNDARVLTLAKMLGATGGKFDEVIEAIDKMIETLKEEQKADYKDKEDCEKDRAEKSREASLIARGIDETTDQITKLLAEIKEIVPQVAEHVASIKDIKEQMVEAERVREAEKAEWQTSDEDDTEAAKLVAEAKDVLKGYYDKGLFLQRRQGQTPAGEAPPPPPSTWEEPYQKKGMEGGGIVAILEMIEDDILRDQDKAKVAEEEAQKEYDEFKKESEEQIKDLEAQITSKEEIHGKKSEEVQTLKDERLGEKKNLDAVMKTLKDMETDCDYIAVHFEVRQKDFAAEIDGLYKAKAILSGAKFDD